MNNQTPPNQPPIPTSSPPSGNHHPHNESVPELNKAQQLLSMFQPASIEKLMEYGDYFTDGQAIHFEYGVERGNVTLYVDYIGLPMLDSTLTPICVACIPPLDSEKRKQGMFVQYEPKRFPQGAYVLGRLTQHNRVFVVEDLEAGHKLHAAYPDDMVLVTMTRINMAHVLKAWHKRAANRLYVYVACQLVGEYQEDVFDKCVCNGYSIDYGIESCISNAEVRKLVDDAKPLEMQNGQEQKPLTVEQKNQLSWDEINQREPISLLIDDHGIPNPYPLEALPPLAKAAVEAIAYYAQAPIAMAGQCVLGEMSYLAQRHVNAFDRFSEKGKPCSLFLITEGASGDRKTTCQKMANQRTFERERRNMQEYQQKFDEHQVALANAKGLKEREAFTSENPEPRDPQSLFTDSTLEPIVTRYIQESMTDAAWCSDEAGQIFGGHTLKGDTRDSALGGLTKLWDEGKAQRTRSKSNQNSSGTAYDVRLTINTLGQRVVLEAALNDPVMREQGFLPRFLFAAPHSLAGKRTHTAETWSASPYKDPRLLQYWQRCTQLLDIEQQHDEQAQVIRKVIPITPEAQPLLLGLYNATEQEQAKAGQYAHMKAFAARSAELATRVATVLAFFEGMTAITVDIMQSAITLVRYSLDEWERYGDGIEHDKRLVEADRLENWLIRYCREHNTTFVSRSETLKKATPRSLRKAKPLNEALKILAERSHVRQVKQDGKQMIELNPKLFGIKLDMAA